ncbi:hypothetical protein BDY19DRAFT_732950 [Irpex rosettiformis]|uniref:Uncharacterized protein n=1 Tax=Irpex rosettiformis TaxID=378272 RepID=A0ACB8U8S3_9APHY|nr:hypothetical protein BDY19DRAFT_732950 [Irpex rosettiformis]
MIIENSSSLIVFWYAENAWHSSRMVVVQPVGRVQVPRYVCDYSNGRCIFCPCPSSGFTPCEIRGVSEGSQVNLGKGREGMRELRRSHLYYSYTCYGLSSRYRDPFLPRIHWPRTLADLGNTMFGRMESATWRKRYDFEVRNLRRPVTLSRLSIRAERRLSYRPLGTASIG